MTARTGYKRGTAFRGAAPALVMLREARPPAMAREARRKYRGFNLVETLVAGMILSGAVLTLGAISTNALTDVRLNRHYEVAAALIERQLTLIDYIGIDTFIEAGQMEGLFEEFEPGYQWEVSTEYQGTDNLYLVTITMNWLEGRRPRSMTVQTMLNGAGAVLGTGAGAAQTQEQQTQR